MGIYGLVLGGLAVWRITYLLSLEDGPADVFIRLRTFAAKVPGGKLLTCFYCLSMWVAIPFAYWLGGNWAQRAMLWPALSAAAILLERLAPPAPYVEGNFAGQAEGQGEER
jgi:hypothetical protein